MSLLLETSIHFSHVASFQRGDHCMKSQEKIIYVPGDPWILLTNCGLLFVILPAGIFQPCHITNNSCGPGKKCDVLYMSIYGHADCSMLSCKA